MGGYVGFPGLGLEFHIKRVAFHIFGWPLYWYGIIIACAVLACILLAVRNVKKVNLSPDTLYDYLIWAIPLSIVGARLYYVLSSWETYRSHPASILYIWEGGLAIYGAIIAAVITLLVFCRCKKVPAYDLMDACCISLILGQAIGRWGNFINQEAFGAATTLPWRMRILDEAGRLVEVHPTFLYESLWNLIGFALLLYVFNRQRKFPGLVFWLYVLWYGMGRFFIEGLRTDSLMMGNIRLSQLVAALSAIAAVVMLVIGFRKWWLEDKAQKSMQVNEQEQAQHDIQKSAQEKTQE